MKKKLFVFVLMFSGAIYAQESPPLISLSRFQPFQHNYIMLAELNAPKEMKIQMSIKYEVWDSPRLYFGYVQKTFWNALDLAQSFPATEIDFHPMGFWERRFSSSDLEYLQIGYEHESNGKHVPLWRAWDRVFAEIQTKPLVGLLDVRTRVWVPLYSSTENSDIIDYLGYGEVEIRVADYKTLPVGIGFTFRKGVIGGFRDASVEANLALLVFRILGMEENSPPNFSWHLQFWSGVGERLLNYNIPTKSVRTGFSITY